MSKPWSSLAVASEPQKMVILHPSTGVPIKDKNGTEAFLLLHSTDDPCADEVRREMFNKVRPQQQRKGFRAGVTPTMDLDDAIEAQSSLLAALVAGWYLVDLDGNPILEDGPKVEGEEAKPYKFTNQRAREIFSARSMSWLREQADEFTNERTNFFKASESS